MELNEIGSELLAEINKMKSPMIYMGDLDEALHTMSECGCWPDNVDSVSWEQVLLSWRLVEFIRKNESFPLKYRL